MSTFDPGKLATVLDDLRSDMTRWSEVAQDAMRYAEKAQRHGKETCTRAQRQANIIHDQAQKDVKSAETASAEVQTLCGKCQDLTRSAQQTKKMTDQAMQKASATLSEWRNELQKAKAWLQQALARLERAKQQLRDAQDRLASAQSELSSARSALSSCQSDPKRNCSGESARVLSAQSAVSAAKKEVQGAEAEVRAAAEEVKEARARVACCEQAVGFAEQAVDVAKVAQQTAVEAIDAADRSSTEARYAQDAVGKAQKAAENGKQLAETMLQEVRGAQREMTQAAGSLGKANNAADASQNYAKQGGRELDERSENLRQLDRNLAAILYLRSLTIIDYINRYGEILQGNAGERKARQWLQEKYRHYKIISGQYRGNQGIDLIAVGKKRVIFAEVKTHARTPTLSTYGQQGSRSVIGNRLNRAIAEADRSNNLVQSQQLRRAQELFKRNRWESLGVGYSPGKDEFKVLDLKRRPRLK